GCRSEYISSGELHTPGSALLTAGNARLHFAAAATGMKYSENFQTIRENAVVGEVGELANSCRTHIFSDHAIHFGHFRNAVDQGRKPIEELAPQPSALFFVPTCSGNKVFLCLWPDDDWQTAQGEFLRLSSSFTCSQGIPFSG